METIQQQIGAMQEEIKRLREELEEVKQGNFDIVTCQEWNVLDAKGKLRIAAFTDPNGNASVTWLDKDGKLRISAYTTADGDGTVLWIDKDGEARIAASTFADGTVDLPTKDRTTPIKP